MKILGIRGKNLASLAGHFDVDFQREPLASTGLFAICGPTGAGKSTLLDALCLALYDATPRLSRAGSRGIGLPDVQGETVTPQDTRTLLRRGTAEGYAEVDFLGNDGNTYRARWSVRRARAKADGALQKVRMTLAQLPQEQPIGGTNSEVKEEIERRIGLSFEQFTRAVLLAQNEFAAFLKADDGERGELLEMLTGTAIYTDLSRRAYERAKAEQHALQQLQSRLADQKPLEPEARTQLEADAQHARDIAAVLEERKGLLEAHLRWHQADEQMRQGEQQARDEFARLQAEHEAAAPRRGDFTLVESVQVARPLLVERDRCADEVVQGTQALAEREAAATQAQHALRQADDDLVAAMQAGQEAERALADAQPMLDQAKALDAQIAALEPAHRQAQQVLADAREAESTLRQSLQHSDTQRALAQRGWQDAVDWLATHAHLKTLAHDWPRWDMLLAQAAQDADEQQQLEQALGRARESETRCMLAVDEAVARSAASEQLVAAVQARRQQAQERLARFDGTTLAARRKAIETRREELASAEQLWQRLWASRNTQAEVDAQLVLQRVALAEAEVTLQGIDARLPHANGALAQAERSLKAAEAACNDNVEHLRAALVDGAACPVCGSCEHPYRAADPQLRALLEGLQAELERCRDTARQLSREQAAQTALAAQLRQQLDSLTRQAQALACAAEKDRHAWEAHPLASEWRDIDAARCGEWLAGHRARAQEELQAIDRQDDEMRAAARERDAAQQEWDAAAARHAADKDAATAAQAALTQAQAELAALADKCAQAGRRLQAALGALDAAFADQRWRAAWQQEPEAFHARCQHDAAQWDAHCTRRDSCTMEIGRHEAERNALAESLARAQEEVARSAKAFADSSAGIEEKKAARRALFEGEAVAQVGARLTAAIDAARARLAAHTQARQQCANAEARARESLEQARQRLSAQEQAAAASAAALTDWIAGFNQEAAQALDDPGLRRLLAHSAQWIAEQRRQLQAVESALQNARTVLQERVSQRQAHESQRPTEESAQAVQAALDALAGEREDAARHATALQLALADDDARRLKSASMRDEIARQEATTRVWTQLGELIGSADGKKFRNYAQQFTLDVLLGYANRHLNELARRYRLERVRDSLALLVVDQDMGEEIRSVHSLSGGESFLVSLALALALASLSSNRVRVESLFIDEGFGSLDAETLSVAMEALDGLQSMGRKVGVISHVQEMTERIATKILVRREAGGRSVVVVE